MTEGISLFYDSSNETFNDKDYKRKSTNKSFHSSDFSLSDHSFNQNSSEMNISTSTKDILDDSFCAKYDNSDNFKEDSSSEDIHKRYSENVLDIKYKRLNPFTSDEVVNSLQHLDIKESEDQEPPIYPSATQFTDDTVISEEEGGGDIELSKKK